MAGRLIALTWFVALVGTVAGQSPQSTGNVYGAGSTSCASWMADAKRLSGASLQMSWVLGYVSGAASSVKFERVVTPEWVAGVMDGHCGGRPMDTLAVAAQAVVRLAQTPDRTQR